MPSPRRRPRLAPWLLAAVLAVALATAGCGAGDGDAASDGVAVVATTTVVGDLARAVGGDAASVRQLLAPNSDPHDYEPRPADVLAVARAQLVLASGQGLDGWIEEVAAQAGGDARLVAVGDGLGPAPDGDGHDHGGHDHGHDHEGDPHWWHDPTNAIAAVRRIEAALRAADPDRAEAYARNAAAYVRRLEALDAGIRRCIRRIPPAQRKLVTDHDTVGAFARRYGLELIGAVIPSQTTQAQASAGDVAELARVVRRERVRAVFPEAGANRKLTEALARETGATADYELYGDGLGPADGPAGTYLGMAAHNADAIVRGLTGGARGCALDGI
jgi:ABC-type Zn uptake system ZnuABC Zn-binding protein ZnuA